MFLVKNDKVMYGLLTRSTDRATYRVRHAFAQCQFPRPGGGCQMVGMMLILKPVDGLYSTASDIPSEARSSSVSIPAPRWWVSDGRNGINIKIRGWATFHCHIFVERG